MNVQQQAAGSGGLGLPAPRSPGELDRKVLRYAESRAPDAIQRPNRLLWWGSGLATASVAALALFLALPQPGLNPEPAGDPAPPVPSLNAARAPTETAADAGSQPASRAARITADAPPAAALEAPSADVEPAGTVAAELERLADLLAAGRESEAREGYGALRARCPRCGLPPSLELALGRNGAGTR
jgi:hypothetical protein